MSIQDMREKRATLAKNARDIVDADTYAKADEEKVDAIFAEIDDLDGQIARVEKALELEAKNDAKLENIASNLGGVSIDEAADHAAMRNGILNTWLRGGNENLSEEQRQYIQNTMSTTTDSEGGYLAPDDFSATLLEELLSFGGMRSVSTVISTADGNTIEFPTVDNTGVVGELVAENGAVSNSDPSFGVKSIAAYKYSSKDIAVPFELLQDSRVDLEGYISKALAERLGRITNTHYTVGTGSGQPNGVVTAAGSGKVGTTGQTTSVIYDDLIDLIHSVDPAYRARGCHFMLRDSTLAAIRKLKDGNSLPLWQPSVIAGEPDTILGKPYVINNDVAAMAANAKSILFGDFSKYLIRDVMDIRLFRMTDSVYTKAGQVGFLAFLRTDGDLIDQGSSAIKYYANSAT